VTSRVASTAVAASETAAAATVAVRH
jgi:hypothetical protein